MRFAPSEIEAAVSNLLPRVARGEPAAVRDCIRLYGPLVRALAKKFDADSDDAVQEVFLELWKRAATFDPELSPELAFVALIARRKLIDGYRRRKSRPAAAPLPEELMDPGSDVGTSVIVDDQLARVRILLGQLPEEQRAVLLAAVCGGSTQREVAERFELPLGTVKSHIRRGLLYVKDRLVVPDAGGNR